MGYRTQADADMADRVARNTPQIDDHKWVNGSEYVWRGDEWRATGHHVSGITNTPHCGEREGSRDRKPVEVPAPHGTFTILSRLSTDSAERKDVPIYSGPLRYFPDAIAEVARLCKAGNDKHNPGQPLHWSRGKSNDHLDCLTRHLVEAGTMDDDGFLHDVKIAWRALANLQTAIERVRGLPISPGSRE